MRKVLYTVLAGGYDKLRQPSVVDPGFDYVCFTDEARRPEEGVWEIRSIPFETSDLVLLSRYPKMHPQVLFPEYDYSLYIDANVHIISADFYAAVNQKIADNVPIAGVEHPKMDCTYRECLNVILTRKDLDVRTIRKEFRFLRKSGFPERYGMYEANVILRNHHDPKVVAQCELWWQMVQKYSRRDQLSYSYTLWDNGLPFSFIPSDGFEVERHLEEHQSREFTFKEKLINRFFHEVQKYLTFEQIFRRFKFYCMI